MALGRRLSDAGDEAVRIDLSPMIDCVFILLIFFIVTTVFVEETGIDVNRPEGGQQSNQADNEVVELDINAQGVVKYHGRDIGVQGVRGLIKQLRVNKPDIPIIIKADAKTAHRVFAEVYGEIRMTGADPAKISFK
jgi:biopolymer transport protein ExbD